MPSGPSIQTQEKAVIFLPGPYSPASAPDTALFIDALNAGDIEAFAPRLSPDVAMISEDGHQVIRGQAQILNHFTARLDALSDSVTNDHLAVAGLLRVAAEPDEPDGDPCAIFYDGFCKSCVLQLGIGDGHFVDRIVLSARDSTLRRAWPLEPPAFRETAILPSLTRHSER